MKPLNLRDGALYRLSHPNIRKGKSFPAFWENKTQCFKTDPNWYVNRTALEREDGPVPQMVSLTLMVQRVAGDMQPLVNGPKDDNLTVGQSTMGRRIHGDITLTIRREHLKDGARLVEWIQTCLLTRVAP